MRKKNELERRPAAFLMLKKSLFVPDTLEKLFKKSSSMWKYDSCHAAKVSQTSGYPESECWLYNLNLARGKK